MDARMASRATGWTSLTWHMELKKITICSLSMSSALPSTALHNSRVQPERPGALPHLNLRMALLMVANEWRMVVLDLSRIWVDAFLGSG